MAAQGKQPPASWRRLECGRGYISFWDLVTGRQSIYYRTCPGSSSSEVAYMPRPPQGRNWVQRLSEQHPGLHEFVRSDGSTPLVDILGLCPSQAQSTHDEKENAKENSEKEKKAKKSKKEKKHKKHKEDKKGKKEKKTMKRKREMRDDDDTQAATTAGGEGRRRRRLQEEKDGKQESEALTCTICCESFPLEEFAVPICSGPSKCSHERDVCRACVARTIELEVNGKGNSTRVLCPHDGCEAELDFADVCREAAPAVFKRYDDLLLKRALQEEPGFRWCAHAGCGNGQIVSDIDPSDDGFNHFLCCHVCTGKTCVYHRCCWHHERTCKEYEADGRASEEVALLQYFEQEGVKRCPNCGHAIVKDDRTPSCDHMTCKTSAGGCGAEFCIRCLADYNGANGIRIHGNSAHLSSCPYYFPDPSEDDA